MPCSCSSIGTVISSSTSFEELPSAIVWISTCGGANSGKTSTFAFGIWTTPKTIIAAAANSTSQRNRRLLETIQRITRYPPALSGFLRCRARRRTPRSHRPSRPRCRRPAPLTATHARPSIRSTVTGDPLVRQRLRARVDEGLGLVVVDQRLVGDDLVLAAAAAPSPSGGPTRAAPSLVNVTRWKSSLLPLIGSSFAGS